MKLLWITQVDKLAIVYTESPVNLMGIRLFSKKWKYRVEGMDGRRAIPFGKYPGETFRPLTNGCRNIRLMSRDNWNR